LGGKEREYDRPLRGVKSSIQSLMERVYEGQSRKKGREV